MLGDDGKNTSNLITGKNLILAACSLVLPLFCIVFPWQNLSKNQAFILGILFQAIYVWTVLPCAREITSGYILCMFLLFSGVRAKEILNFPLSTNFLLVIAAFLISQAIEKSGLLSRLSNWLIQKYARSAARMVMLSYLLGAVLVFLIPQPFPRVIILSSLYNKLLSGTHYDEHMKRRILFSVFAAAVSTTAIFINGDIILNTAAFSFVQIDITFTEWMLYMAVPATLASLCFLFLFLIVFGFLKKEARISALPAVPINRDKEDRQVKGKGAFSHEKKSVIILLTTIVLWMTESIHHITFVQSSLLSVGAFYCARVLSVKDVRTIDLRLLLFLTAAFSIGRVITLNGTAAVINDVITAHLPSPGNELYLLYVVFLIMGMHMLLGSSITTMAVVIPSITTITQGVLSPLVATFLCYSVINFHYILPIHHAVIMIGNGRGLYSQKETITFGLLLTIATPIIIFVIFLPWWRIM